MDWFFRNRVAPLKSPCKEDLDTHLYRNDDLEDLFVQNESDAELPELQFKRIWDKTADLLIRSRIYPILDGAKGDAGSAESRNVDYIPSSSPDVTEEDVLRSINYYQGDGKVLAYNDCLEYLAKSKLKFGNAATKKKSSNNKCPVRKKYSKRSSTAKRSLHLRLRSLTKVVKSLRRQDHKKSCPPGDRLLSSISTSSSEPISSSSSAAGDYETEATPLNYKLRNTKTKDKYQKIKVPFLSCYTYRRQYFLQLERKDKRRNKKIGCHWSSDCCSKKPQLKRNKYERDFLELCCVSLFVGICIMIVMDAFRFNNEHY